MENSQSATRSWLKNKIIADKPGTKDLQDTVLEFLNGQERWSKDLGPFEVEEEHYIVGYVKLKDIYPLIGGKHKKWDITVFAESKRGEIVERKFVSEDGNDEKCG